MEGIPEKRSRYSPKSVIFMAVKTKPDSLNRFRDYRESTLHSYFFLLKKRRQNSGTTRIMKKAYAELNAAGLYSPSKMLSAMEFGVWKYMFSATQYRTPVSS